MLGRAITKFKKETLVKPVLTRQLGLHKWSAAEEMVKGEYNSRPGRYVVSRAAGCIFCVDVDSQQKLQHRILTDETDITLAIDMTRE